MFSHLCNKEFTYLCLFTPTYLVHVFISLMEAGATMAVIREVGTYSSYLALPSLARLLVGEDMPTCPNI